MQIEAWWDKAHLLQPRSQGSSANKQFFEIGKV